MTQYTLLPSRSASSSRRSATMPRPSPSMVPSARSENGRMSSVFESAGVFEKHMYMKMSFMVSTPPAITRSLSPRYNSFTPIEMAENDDAQAASVTQLVPPRSSRFAIRPATTLPSKPGNVLSVHSGCSPEISSHAARATSSGTPARRIPCNHIGRLMRLAIAPKSSCPDVTPRMTDARDRLSSTNCPRVASSSTRWAMTSARSWAVSVEGITLGGIPKPIASKATGVRKPPRRP